MQRQWHSSKDEKGVKQGNKTSRAFQMKEATVLTSSMFEDKAKHYEWVEEESRGEMKSVTRLVSH